MHTDHHHHYYHHHHHHHHQRLSPQDHAVLVDTARAQALRREAVDTFCDAVIRRARQALRQARQAVTRAARRPLHAHQGRA